MDQTYRIRPVAADDLPALWAINEASTPGVGSVSQAELERLIALPESACFVAAPIVQAAAAIPSPLGFLLLIGPGAAYDSPNYRWFSNRLARGEGRPFAYVDRIAIAPEARGKGLGALLYAAAIEAPSASAETVTCEVNTIPPNPGSMRFHTRLGFREVGRAAHIPGAKEVVFLERPLSTARAKA